jgi:hypothetical protein
METPASFATCWMLLLAVIDISSMWFLSGKVILSLPRLADPAPACRGS